MHSCPDVRAFRSIFWCVNARTLERPTDFRAFDSNSSLEFRVFTRISCVHPIFVHAQTVVRLPDFCVFTQFLCVHTQSFVRSPDFRAFTRFSFMPRLLCVHLTFVCSHNFCAFMPRLLCVQPTFVQAQIFVPTPDFYVHTIFLHSPDFPAFMSRFWWAHAQAFVRSADFRAFVSRLSFVHQTYLGFNSNLYPDLCASPDFCAYSRLSCFHQNFVRSTRVRVYTFIRSTDLPAFSRF